MAPTRGRAKGQSAPTAGTAVHTATPTIPVRGQRAATEKVLSTNMTCTPLSGRGKFLLHFATFWRKRVGEISGSSRRNSPCDHISRLRSAGKKKGLTTMNSAEEASQHYAERLQVLQEVAWALLAA